MWCRRAQLRDCLEVLRQHVPLPDKLTTLALLQSARKYIEVWSSPWCYCHNGAWYNIITEPSAKRKGWWSTSCETSKWASIPTVKVGRTGSNWVCWVHLIWTNSYQLYSRSNYLKRVEHWNNGFPYSHFYWRYKQCCQFDVELAGSIDKICIMHPGIVLVYLLRFTSFTW